MTALLIKAAVLAAAVLIFRAWRRRRHGHEVASEMENVLASDWQGWVEIAGQDYAPLFQGKIVGTSKDHSGALIFGVLVEETAPAPLVSAIRSQSHAHLAEGLVLARCLTSHHKPIIMTELKDRALIERLCATLDSGVEPDTRLVLNSSDIQHMDCPEDERQFDDIWLRNRLEDL